MHAPGPASASCSLLACSTRLSGAPRPPPIPQSYKLAGARHAPAAGAAAEPPAAHLTAPERRAAEPAPRSEQQPAAMSALLRARVSSFLAGVAVAGVFGVYQLRGDVAEGQAQLLEQASPVCRRGSGVAAAQLVAHSGTWLKPRVCTVRSIGTTVPTSRGSSARGSSCIRRGMDWSVQLAATAAVAHISPPSASLSPSAFCRRKSTLLAWRHAWQSWRRRSRGCKSREAPRGGTAAPLPGSLRPRCTENAQ